MGYVKRMISSVKTLKTKLTVTEETDQVPRVCSVKTWRGIQCLPFLQTDSTVHWQRKQRPIKLL